MATARAANVAEQPAGAAQPAAPRAPRYRVRVVNEATPEAPHWEFSLLKDGEHINGPGDKRALIPFLPAPWDKVLMADRSRYQRGFVQGLRACLSAGMAPQLAADALKGWMVINEGVPMEAEAADVGGPDETALLLAKAQPAILTAGGFSYRLVPVHGVDHKPSYQKIARKMKQIAEAQTAGIVEAAKQSARIAIADAREEANAAREEMAALRRNMGNHAPAWIRDTGRAVRWASTAGRWEIELFIGLKITEIVDTIEPWNVTLVWRPILSPRDLSTTRNKARAWVPISADGTYDFRAIHLANGMGNTVHISTGSTCMHLQGLPTSIGNIDHIRSLENALTRGMQVINLNSPLEYGDFNEVYAQQIPPAVRDMLSAGRRSFPHNASGAYLSLENYVQQALRGVASWQETRTLREEADETFTLPEAGVVG